MKTVSKKIGNLIENRPVSTFYLLILLAIAIPLSRFCNGGTEMEAIIGAISEAMLIMLPALFLGPKWRWTALLPCWLVALFCLTNIWYWRFFHDLMPLSSYFLCSNINDTVIDSWLSLVLPSDIVWIVPATSVTCIYFAYFRKRMRNQDCYSKRFRGIAATVVIICYISVVHFYPVYHSIQSLSPAPYTVVQAYIEDSKKHWTEEVCLRWYDYIMLKFTGYLAKQTYFELYNHFHSHTVSKEQVAELNEYLNEHAQLIRDPSFSLNNSPIYPPHCEIT